MNGRVPEPMGNRHQSYAPHGQREGSFTGQPRWGQHSCYVLDELLGLAEEDVETPLVQQAIC